MTLTQDILRRYRNGDKKAFEKIFHELKGLASNTIKRLIKNKEDAEDVLMVAMYKVYKNRSKYTLNKPIEPWVCVIATNTAKDWIRRKRIKTIPINEEITNSCGSEDFYLFNEAERMEQLIDKLPRDMRAAVIYVLYEGISYKQAADNLGISLSLVKKYLADASKLIRTEFE